VQRYPLDHSGPTKQFAIEAPVPGVIVATDVRVAGDGATYAYSVAEFHTELVRVDHAIERQ